MRIAKEKVIAVARAIYIAGAKHGGCKYPIPFDRLPPIDKRAYESMAKAAIKTIQHYKKF